MNTGFCTSIWRARVSVGVLALEGGRAFLAPPGVGSMGRGGQGASAPVVPKCQPHMASRARIPAALQSTNKFVSHRLFGKGGQPRLSCRRLGRRTRLPPPAPATIDAARWTALPCSPSQCTCSALCGRNHTVRSGCCCQLPVPVVGRVLPALPATLTRGTSPTLVAARLLVLPMEAWFRRLAPQAKGEEAGTAALAHAPAGPGSPKICHAVLHSCPRSWARCCARILDRQR